MILPEMRFDVPKTQNEVVQIGSINYSDQIKDGDLADSRNISARRFPYISTRNLRRRRGTYDEATAISAWDELVVVEGTKVYYAGDVTTGSVTAGPKQFAVVNTKLVIWPDKKYLDLQTRTIHSLGASKSGSDAVFDLDDDTQLMSMTVTWASTDFTNLFKKGDCVELSGGSIAGNNTNVVLTKVEAQKLTFNTKDGMEAGSATGTISVERKIPDLDFICESENRLWGCSSSDRTIYASALGDPTNFYTYEGLATDSYAVAVGSEGAFTGCCKLGSSVLFWKETVMHKILGSFPAEYSLYTYTLDGLKAGCEKSLQVINETLFYMGLHGVYAYTGGTPVLISPNFGNKNFANAAAGNDGDTYYLCVQEGEDQHHLFAYETKYGLWVLEDDIEVVQFARVGKDLYFLMADQKVWYADGGQQLSSIEWYAQFCPMYETIRGRKRYSKLLIRTELPIGSYIIAEVRYDGGVWQEACKIYGGKADVSTMYFAVNRCDKFELRLSGKGPCTILSFMRQFSVGSDV
jgi:hypothetical protein